MNVLIAWIIFVIAAVSVAKSKNRNVLLWAGLGVLLGPFAIIVVALLDSVPLEKSEQESDP